MKIDIKRTTTYITTKKRMGCRAPKERELDFMIEDFGFYELDIDWPGNG